MKKTTAKKEEIHTLPCATLGCSGKISERCITGLCARCYSSIYNWTKRSARDRVARAITLQLYEARLSFLIPADKIKVLRPSRKVEPLVVLPGQVKKYRKKTRSKYKVMNTVADKAAQS